MRPVTQSFVCAARPVRGVIPLATILLAACATTQPPVELVQARAEYQRARTGPANQVAPAQVHVAKEALDVAERRFADDPGSPEARDRAYIALRRAQLAEAQADLIIAERDRNKARAEAQELQVQMGQKAQSELNAAQQQIAQERQARLEAERRAREALEDLAKLATVRQEARGTVIVLPGSVLFASGQSTVLPGAQSRLDGVVAALKLQPERSVLIEGHTDSQGTRAFNMALSQRRADAVRSYFVAHAIAPERIRSQGIGPDRPVADNATAEGRANNRRVEIVILPSGGAPPAGAPPQEGGSPQGGSPPRGTPRSKYK